MLNPERKSLVFMVVLRFVGLLRVLKFWIEAEIGKLTGSFTIKAIKPVEKPTKL